MRWIAVWLLAGCRFSGGQLGDAAPGEPPDDTVTPPPGDTAADTQSGCAGNFTAIPGGTQGHRYLVVATSDPWLTQQNTVCTGLTSYLAIPDDGEELDALFKLANVNVWLGVTDRLTEGTFRDTKNQLYTALQISGNTQVTDCVGTNDGVLLGVDDCDIEKPAVCECEE